jgi:hypothetical protein
LTSATIPNSVITIGEYAFNDCASLTNVTLGKSVTNIGAWAFLSCSNLTTVTIPNSVTAIGGFAFYYCSSLTSVYFMGNAPNVDYRAFQNDPTTLYYLSGTTGWASSPLLGCYPTVMWSPSIQTTNATFGLQSNQFGFPITGPTNLPILVQAATNLANPVWTNVLSCTLTNGAIYFADPSWSNYPSQFYRVLYLLP